MAKRARQAKAAPAGLTPGAVDALARDLGALTTPGRFLLPSQPLLQSGQLDEAKLNPNLALAETPRDAFDLVLSDGKHMFTAVLAADLAPMVRSGVLRDLTLARVVLVAVVRAGPRQPQLVVATALTVEARPEVVLWDSGADTITRHKVIGDQRRPQQPRDRSRGSYVPLWNDDCLAYAAQMPAPYSPAGAWPVRAQLEAAGCIDKQGLDKHAEALAAGRLLPDLRWAGLSPVSKSPAVPPRFSLREILADAITALRATWANGQPRRSVTVHPVAGLVTLKRAPALIVSPANDGLRWPVKFTFQIADGSAKLDVVCWNRACARFLRLVRVGDIVLLPHPRLKCRKALHRMAPGAVMPLLGADDFELVLDSPLVRPVSELSDLPRTAVSVIDFDYRGGGGGGEDDDVGSATDNDSERDPDESEGTASASAREAYSGNRVPALVPLSAAAAPLWLRALRERQRAVDAGPAPRNPAGSPRRAIGGIRLAEWLTARELPREAERLSRKVAGAAARRYTVAGQIVALGRREVMRSQTGGMFEFRWLRLREKARAKTEAVVQLFANANERAFLGMSLGDVVLLTRLALCSGLDRQGACLRSTGETEALVGEDFAAAAPAMYGVLADAALDPRGPGSDILRTGAGGTVRKESRASKRRKPLPVLSSDTPNVTLELMTRDAGQPSLGCRPLTFGLQRRFQPFTTLSLAGVAKAKTSLMLGETKHYVVVARLASSVFHRSEPSGVFELRVELEGEGRKLRAVVRRQPYLAPLPPIATMTNRKLAKRFFRKRLRCQEAGDQEQRYWVEMHRFEFGKAGVEVLVNAALPPEPAPAPAPASAPALAPALAPAAAPASAST